MHISTGWGSTGIAAKGDNCKAARINVDSAYAVSEILPPVLICVECDDADYNPGGIECVGSSR